MTLDDLQNGYYIYQNEHGFRFGMDAVLISGYAEVKRSESVLDLGSGTGIIPILLASKTESRVIRGIELFDANVELAEKSIEYNKLSDRIEVIRGDIRRIRDLYREASFNVCVSNPPYMPSGHGYLSPDEVKAAARHEICCSIDDVAAAASWCLKSGGRFYMVHRPERLSDIFRALSGKHLEVKRMRFVHPRPGEAPNLILMEARKGGAPGLTVETPLFIYNDDGSYTEDALYYYGS